MCQFWSFAGYFVWHCVLAQRPLQNWWKITTPQSYTKPTGRMVAAYRQETHLRSCENKVSLQYAPWGHLLTCQRRKPVSTINVKHMSHEAEPRLKSLDFFSEISYQCEALATVVFVRTLPVPLLESALASQTAPRFA